MREKLKSHTLWIVLGIIAPLAFFILFKSLFYLPTWLPLHFSIALNPNTKVPDILGFGLNSTNTFYTGMAAIFSGLAFIGLLITIGQQRKALRMQQEEMELQRQEMKRQSAEFEESNILATKSTEQQILYQLLTEYRKPEMFYAVKCLWGFFWNKCDGDSTKVAEVFKRIRSEESKAIDQLPPDQRLNALATTLEYQRKLISSFYQLLAGYHDMEVIEARFIYTFFATTDIEIVMKVILPMDNVVFTEANQSAPNLSDGARRLIKLYDDSKIVPDLRKTVTDN